MITQASARTSPNEVTTPVVVDEGNSGVPIKIGGYRWKICGLLFFATTLNYMDRQVLGLLKPTLQDPTRGIGLTEVQFAAIVSVFSAAYAIGLLLAGNFIDKVGTRVGYAVALIIWTSAAIGHSLAGVAAVTGLLHRMAAGLASGLRHIPTLGSAHWVWSMANLSGAVIAFGIARFVLGLGEAGNSPAAIKAVAEWFPRKERALATGIFNSGTNIGATLAPFAVGFLYRLGWQYAFLTTSAFAVIWLVLWLTLYRSPAENPRVGSRAGLHQQGIRGGGIEDCMVAAHSASTDMGLCHRKGHNRSDMVVLSLLAAGISQRSFRVDPHQDGTATARYL